MTMWMQGARALTMTTVLLGALAVGCAPGTETPDGSDGGSVEGNDAGSAGGADAGNEPQPVARRSLNASGSVTSAPSLAFVPPVCSGACPANPIPSYPDGASLNQWAQLSDPVSGDLYFSVTRLRRDERNGSSTDVREFLAFQFPREATGTVACGGEAATGHLFVGDITNTLDSQQTGLLPSCAFDVIENSATKVKVEFKSEFFVPVMPGNAAGWTIGAGVIELPVKAYAALPDRAHSGNFTITTRFVDGTSVEGTTNPRAFVFEGNIAATAVGNIPGGTGSVDVRVPKEAVGFVPCANGGPGVVSVSLMAGQNFFAFATDTSRALCKLLVVRNDATHFTVVNVGQVFLPASLGGEGEITMTSLFVDAPLQ